MAGKKKKPKKPKPDIIDTTMSLGDHLEELRARILLALLGLAIGTIVGLIFGRQVFSLILAPYNGIKPPPPPLVTLGPPDAFTAYFKVSMIAGLILTSPWVFYQLWAFVAAGLYRHERGYIYRSLPFSVVLFVVGALFFLLVVAPLCLKFFIGFGSWLGVGTGWTLQKYTSFITILMLVFGLAFQTPIAIFILNRTGLVSIEAFKKSRKYIFLAVFIIAAVVTPPDIISQISLGIPLYALFELGILISWLSARTRKKPADPTDTGDSGPRAPAPSSPDPCVDGKVPTDMGPPEPENCSCDEKLYSSTGGGDPSRSDAYNQAMPADTANSESEDPSGQTSRAADGSGPRVSDGYPEPVYMGEPQDTAPADVDTEGETPEPPIQSDAKPPEPMGHDSEPIDAEKRTDEQVDGDGGPAAAADEPTKPDEQVYSD